MMYLPGEKLTQWMYEQQVKHRIACEQLDYPPSEALYPSIKAWEEANGTKWYSHLSRVLS